MTHCTWLTKSAAPTTIPGLNPILDSVLSAATSIGSAGKAKLNPKLVEMLGGSSSKLGGKPITAESIADLVTGMPATVKREFTDIGEPRLAMLIDGITLAPLEGTALQGLAEKYLKIRYGDTLKSIAPAVKIVKRKPSRLLTNNMLKSPAKPAKLDGGKVIPISAAPTPDSEKILRLDFNKIGEEMKKCSWLKDKNFSKQAVLGSMGTELASLIPLLAYYASKNKGVNKFMSKSMDNLKKITGTLHKSKPMPPLQGK